MADVQAEYLYLRERLQGHEYRVVAQETKTIQGMPYDILSVRDVAADITHDFYFDVSHALDNAENNLNKLLADRKEKDKKTVMDWLEDKNFDDPEEIWDESHAITTEAYDLIKEHDGLIEEVLQDKLGVSKEVAAAIIFRFKFRGWLQ